MRDSPPALALINLFLRADNMIEGELMEAMVRRNIETNRNGERRLCDVRSSHKP